MTREKNGRVGILRKNMVFTSHFQDKNDCQVFQTLGGHHTSRMETCYAARLLLFFCLNTWPQLSATVLALGGNYFPFMKLQNSYAD